LRLLVYNIRYATGTGPAFHLPLPGAGYLRSNRKILTGITEFIRAEEADVVGLIEVDTGSIRTGMVNQAEHIAGQLGHYSTFQCKYGTSSINNLMPIVRKQANAFLSAPHVHGERFHYFDTGIKRLIIELELEDVCVFLVHLSLKFRHRQYQLRSLHDLIVESPKPVIVVFHQSVVRIVSSNARRMPSLSALRPVGKAEVGGRTFEVKTLGGYVTSGTKIRIIQILSNQIIVEPTP